MRRKAQQKRCLFCSRFCSLVAPVEARREVGRIERAIEDVCDVFDSVKEKDLKRKILGIADLLDTRAQAIGSLSGETSDRLARIKRRRL